MLSALKDLEQVFIEDMDTYIKLQFSRDSLTGFNTTSTLNSRFNDESLPSSFRQGNDNSGSKVTISKDKIEYKLESKLPYARIQEEGGFIKSKGRMHKYFFMRFKETKFEFFKRIALGVLKNGGVNIKARPYLEPALNDFDWNPLVERFIRSLNASKSI